MVTLTKQQKDWLAKNNTIACCIVEAIGTFCIVFFGGWAYLRYELNKAEFPWTGVALTQGIITMGCCIAAQKLSGGHFNWAVTIALAGLKRMPVGAAFYYILAQTIGSFVAAFMIDTLTPEEYDKATITKMGFPRMSEDYNETSGFFVETIATGMYMYMVMCFSFDQRMPKGIYGIACGMASMLGIVSIGPITGGCLNPARLIGPICITLFFGTKTPDIYEQLHVYWFYFLGPIFGALLVSFYYEFFVIIEEEQEPDLSVASYENDEELKKLKY